MRVRPTNGIGPTQGERKTLTDHRLSYKVRREQVMGIEGVKFPAMNVYK